MINLSSCFYEANFTIEALNVLDLNEESINYQLYMIVDEISAIIGEKPKNIIIYLTEAIKIYLGFLLARCLYHHELF